MGDKQLQLETALEKLKDRGIRLLQTSTRIETEPWGGGAGHLFESGGRG